MNTNQTINEVNSLIDHCEKSGWIPQHDCRKNLKLLSQTHSVNTLHNIVIAQTKQCKICGKKLEEFDPRGL